MQEFRVVEVESEGLLDNYAARSLGTPSKYAAS